jgi:hypothetical protein
MQAEMIILAALQNSARHDGHWNEAQVDPDL